MNINEIKTYTLRAEHRAQNDGGWEEIQCYKRTFDIKLLKPFDEIFHDSQLKINYISEAQSGFIYEIEITNVSTQFSERLKPAEDLYNRSNSLFDQLQLQVRNNGALQIQNRAELANSWKEIRYKLQEEYESIVTEKYLEKMSLFFQTEKTFHEAFSQYFYFGLLFPCIPVKYNSKWENKRILRLSPYDNERFEEKIHFINEENGLRKYGISGIAIPGNQMELKTYAGIISFNPIEKLIDKAQVKIELQQDDFMSEWNFVLE